MKKKPLVIITGPTAVGKTEASIEFAKAMNGSIISADSIQVYKYMDIGSAKIMPPEMQGIKHYLVDELDPADSFNIYRFKQLAEKYIEEIYSENKLPILVGGTGFYIQSVLYDIDFSEKEDISECRKRLEAMAVEKGAAYMHKMLEDIDIKSAETIHMNNLKRVIRAIEFYEQTGKRISEHNAEQSQKESPYDFRYFVLNRERSVIYERIDRRIDMMIEQGLVGEVEKLLKMGYNRDLVSMQGLGYKEIAAFLAGEISLEEAIYILKRDTRHFAKRQLTWFKREKSTIWLDYEDFGNSARNLCEEMIKLSKDMIHQSI